MNRYKDNFVSAERRVITLKQLTVERLLLTCLVLANRTQVACTEIGDECLCYWRADQNGTFDEALTYCLSDGGTLFYPNNPDKVDAVAEFNQAER